MGTKIITPPNVTALVSDADLRTHLHIAADGTEDGLMRTYFKAAHATAEHYTRYPIGLQTVEIALDKFPEGEIELGYAVKDITSVSYIDPNGVGQTVSSTNYTLDDYGCPCWIIPALNFEWPSTSEVANAVKVRFRSGETVPDGVMSALLLMTAWLYQNAGDEMSPDDIQPAAAKSLLNTVKDWSL